MVGRDSGLESWALAKAALWWGSHAWPRRGTGLAGGMRDALGALMRALPSLWEMHGREAYHREVNCTPQGKNCGGSSKKGYWADDDWRDWQPLDESQVRGT